MSLQLVVQGLTDAAMFTAEGDAVSPGEVLYGKDVLVLRGGFHPITNTMMDMLENGVAQFTSGRPVNEDKPVVLLEMTHHNLTGDSGIDTADFLARATLLEKLGKMVLITNLAHFYSVAVYLSHFRIKRIAIILGVPALMQVFDETYYTNLEGGILEVGMRVRAFDDLVIHIQVGGIQHRSQKIIDFRSHFLNRILCLFHGLFPGTLLGFLGRDLNCRRHHGAVEHPLLRDADQVAGQPV